MFNSLVSLRQLNQPELASFISGFLTGLTTGTQTTNNYINSGAITTGQTGIFVTIPYLTSTLASQSLQASFTYYPLSNPSGFTSTSEFTGVISFLGLNGITISGSGQSIIVSQSSFLTGFNSGLYTLNSNTGNFITNYQTGNFLINPLNSLNINGSLTCENLIVLNGGVFSDNSNNNLQIQSDENLILETDGGSNDANVGINQTNPIFTLDINGLIGNSNINNNSTIDIGNSLLQNISGTSLDWNNKILYGNWTAQNLNLNGNSLTINSGFSNLNCLPTTIWNVISGVVEDKRILNLTGSITLAISGLYNGWAGLLKTIQSGSGFNLNLPSGTKVAYNGSGQISLTTGIPGSIDFLSFVYDGNTLFANIANQFS